MFMLARLSFMLLITGGMAGWCGHCENAPHRGWSWWFGWGDCKCYDGWSGDCCDSWSVTDWDKKVYEWNRGESCKAQPGAACRGVQTNSPPPVNHAQQWDYEPSKEYSTQSQCVSAGCIWSTCFPLEPGFTYDSADEMCSHCDGPWKGKCKWDHYEPPWFAFAGPGEHCGFKYPACPASEGENCFCGAAKDDLISGWNDGGKGMDKFCPKAMDHGDGRTQKCLWNGWTIDPQ